MWYFRFPRISLAAEKKAEELTGVPVKNIGGYLGYSGNANRSFYIGREIETSFFPKGRKNNNVLRSALKQEVAKVRATAMEVPFRDTERALRL